MMSDRRHVQSLTNQLSVLQFLVLAILFVLTLFPKVQSTPSHLVAFVLKPATHPRYDERFKKKTSLDRTITQDGFLASGTLVSITWVLTTAKPLVYFKMAEYNLVVTNSSFTLPLQHHSLKRHDVDWVVLHPKYKSEDDVNYDLALARVTSLPEQFAPVALINDSTSTNCRLTFWKYPDVTKEALDITLRNGDSCGSDQFKDCFGIETPPKLCAFTLGSSVTCNNHLRGIFTGRNGNVDCETKSDTTTFTSLTLLPGTETRKWIDKVSKTKTYIFSDDSQPVLDRIKDDANNANSNYNSSYRFRVCASTPTFSSKLQVVLVIIFIGTIIKTMAN